MRQVDDGGRVDQEGGFLHRHLGRQGWVILGVVSSLILVAALIVVGLESAPPGTAKGRSAVPVSVGTAHVHSSSTGVSPATQSTPHSSSVAGPSTAAAAASSKLPKNFPASFGIPPGFDVASATESAAADATVASLDVDFDVPEVVLAAASNLESILTKGGWTIDRPADAAQLADFDVTGHGWMGSYLVSAGTKPASTSVVNLQLQSCGKACGI